MVKRRLSQVLGAIEKGYAVDTFEGAFPMVQTNLDIVAKSATAVHAAVTLTTAAQEVTTALTDPATFRCLEAVGNQGDVYATVTIHGTDWADRTISEAVLASGTTPGVTLQPFKTVSSVSLPVRSATGQTVSVGTTDKVGLYRPLAAGQTGVVVLKVDGTAEAAAAVDATYATFTPTTATNGAHDYEVQYLIDVF